MLSTFLTGPVGEVEGGYQEYDPGRALQVLRG